MLSALAKASTFMRSALASSWVMPCVMTAGAGVACSAGRCVEPAASLIRADMRCFAIVYQQLCAINSSTLHTHIHRDWHGLITLHLLM